MATITGKNELNSDSIFKFGGVEASKLETATSANGVATINSPAGTVTTESLTIPAGLSSNLTVTNAFVNSATDIVFSSIRNVTNTGGRPTIGTYSTSAAGVMSVVIINASGTGSDSAGVVSGTLAVSFFVLNSPTAVGTPPG